MLEANNDNDKEYRGPRSSDITLMLPVAVCQDTFVPTHTMRTERDR